MDYGERNAKRFISLIDTLYDNAVKLMASAAADPVSLYLADEGNEANEFNGLVAADRNELESYLALPHGRKDSAASGSSTGCGDLSPLASLRAKRSNPPLRTGIDDCFVAYAPRNDGGQPCIPDRNQGKSAARPTIGHAAT